MKDSVLLAEREKVFDQLRELNEQRKLMQVELEKSRRQTSMIGSEIDSLNRQIQTTSKLIEIMILNDCDPVEAKLKYQEEIELASADSLQERTIGATGAAYPYTTTTIRSTGSVAPYGSGGGSIHSGGSIGSIHTVGSGGTSGNLSRRGIKSWKI